LAPDRILDGGPLSSARALEIGLVSEVIPGKKLVERAVAVAERLGSRSKLAVGAAKRAVYEGGSLPLSAGLRLERAEFIATIASADAIAAMNAYVPQTERSGELAAYDRATFEQALERERIEAS
jgi:enoyl-CoA hydratase/carnithine racemase